MAHAGHVSFASAHAGKKPFETTKLDYGEQVLWSDHCVQGSRGAMISEDLATDFCVAWTALDARQAGFDTFVIEDASRGINTMGSLDAAWRNMGQAGVQRITSAAIA